VVKKIKKRSFLLTFYDSDSELHNSAVAVIEVDSTEKDLLKDIINRHLIDLKIIQSVSNWRGCKYIRHTIEKTEGGFDLYSVDVIMEDEDGQDNYLFYLEEIRAF